MNAVTNSQDIRDFMTPWQRTKGIHCLCQSSHFGFENDRRDIPSNKGLAQPNDTKFHRCILSAGGHLYCCILYTRKGRQIIVCYIRRFHAFRGVECWHLPKPGLALYTFHSTCVYQVAKSRTTSELLHFRSA